DQLPRYSPNYILLGAILILGSRGLARITLPPTWRFCAACGMDHPRCHRGNCHGCDAPLEGRRERASGPLRAHDIFTQAVRGVGLLVFIDAFNGPAWNLLVYLMMERPWTLGSWQLQWTSSMSELLTTFVLRLGMGAFMLLWPGLLTRVLRGTPTPREVSV
ncbi:MAG: hypothetical protein JXO22_14255, partial [Phycisphaerae bacterium]|nr:hypothetical protein [Phycisphaerae bacterium]